MRTILTALVALAIAIGTTMLARGWLESGRQRQVAAPAPAVVEKPQVSVMVAAVDLAPGAKVKPEHVRWQFWPENGVAKEYLVHGKSTVADVEGDVVRFPIVAGQPIMPRLLINPGDRSALAAVVGEGMRAMTVAIDDTTGNAGLLLPGDHVDVILTQSVQTQDQQGEGTQTNNRRVSETVLSNVRVIATGRRLSGFAEEESQKAQSVRTATLEVTPNDAQRLALASELGKLSLSLRGVVRSEHEVAEMPSAPTWDSAVSKALEAGNATTQRVVVMRGTGSTTTLSVPTIHLVDKTSEIGTEKSKETVE